MPTIEPLKQAVSGTRRAGNASRVILFATVFVDLLGFGIVIPFLPMFAERVGVGASGIGVILAAYSLAQLVCAPMLGRISDRVGRRPIIMLGLLGSSLGYLVYGFAGSYAGLLLSRLVHGACAATVPTAQAYIADTTAEHERAHGMGLIGAAFGLGFVLGPALGGLLGRGSLRTPVFFAAALTFANFIFAAVRLPESHTPDRSARLELGAITAPILALPGELVGHRLARLFGIAFVLTFALAALEATFAMMVPAVYGYGAAGVGLLLGLAGLAQAVAQGYLVGKLVTRLGELTLVRIGLLLLALGMLPIGTINARGGLWMMIAVVSIGYGFASPSVASLISRRTERYQQGEVLGVNQSALSLARIFGPVAGGVIYQVAGPAAPYVVGAVAAVIALLMTGAIETV